MLNGVSKDETPIIRPGARVRIVGQDNKRESKTEKALGKEKTKAKSKNNDAENGLTDKLLPDQYA